MVAAGGLGGDLSGRHPCKSPVGAPGFEPRTSSLSGKGSTRALPGNVRSRRACNPASRVRESKRQPSPSAGHDRPPPSHLVPDVPPVPSERTDLGCRGIADGLEA